MVINKPVVRDQICQEHFSKSSLIKEYFKKSTASKVKRCRRVIVLKRDTSKLTASSFCFQYIGTRVLNQ